MINSRVNIREKLFELEDAVLEMRTTALQSEQNLQTHLEKENSTIASTVNRQIS